MDTTKGKITQSGIRNSGLSKYTTILMPRMKPDKANDMQTELDSTQLTMLGVMR